MSELTSSGEARAGDLPGRLRILGIVVASILAVGTLVVFSATLYTPDGVSGNALITHVLLPTADALIMLLIVLVAKRRGAVGTLDLVWFRRGRFEVAAMVLLPVATLLLMASAVAAVEAAGLPWKDDRVFSADGRGIAFFAALTIYLAVIGPLLEEVFWRGYIQRGLERIMTPFLAMVAQAVLFTSVHVRPLGGLAPVFVLGLITGTWRWRRRTLVPIIVTHVVLNSLYCAIHWPNWLDCARIRATTDYVAKMAEVVRPPDYDPNADARFCYERASRAVFEMPERLGQYRRGFPVDWPEEVFQQLREWVAANETALEFVAEGTRKPYYCPSYTGPTALLAGIPEAAGIRSLAFVLDTRIKLRAFDGEDDLLISDITTLYRLGCHFSGAKVLSHQLIGLGIRTLMTDTIRGILACEPLSPQTLAAIQERLEQLGDADRGTLSFVVERLVWQDGIQRMFTDDGNGHGRIPRAVVAGWGRLPEPLTRLIDPLTPEQNAALLGLSRQETSRCAEEFLGLLEVATTRTPWQFHTESSGVKDALDRLIKENAYVGLLGTACAGTIELPWRARADFDALVATVAALRYEAERREYPQSLAELVEAGFLRRVPQDPYSDGPLIYRAGAGGFLLYSRGLDFDDDGGTPSQWGRGPDGGDQLFWPVR